MALVTGTPGDDILDGSPADDVLQGLGGGDLLNGRGGRDRLEGGLGDDIIVVDSADDLAVELDGEGNDRIYAEASYRLADSQSIEILSARDWASTSNLASTGNGFANALYGNAGNNLLDGGGGVDLLVGFGGDDVYVVDDARDRVVERPGGGDDTLYTSVSYALAADAEVELLSARDWRSTTPLTLTGNGLANTIDGNDGANFIDGGAGADLMIGFAGDDIYVVDDAGDRTAEDGDRDLPDAGGFDTVFTEVSYMLGDDTFIELLSARDWASTTKLNLTGNAYANIIDGNDGDNIIDGAGGNDQMIGFGGDDTYYIREQGDTVVEAADGGTDTILFDTSRFVIFRLNQQPQIENLGAIDPARLNPTGNGAEFSGNDLDNRLTGTISNDVLDGRAGADVMIGLSGDDFYRVDNDGDQVIEAIGEGDEDNINTTASLTLAADSEVEFIYATQGNGSFTLIGSDTANRIRGAEEDDQIDGRGGADFLDGGRGSDTLNGGDGADIFHFGNTSEYGVDVDTIVDFASGEDLVILEAAVFKQMPGPLPESAFVIGTAAQDADDRILYDDATGRLFFDSDGTGSIESIQFFVLQGAPTLLFSDIGFMVDP